MDEVWQKRQKRDIIGMNLYDQTTDFTVCGVCAPFQTDVHNHNGGYAFTLYDSSEYIGHCYVKCYPEQQKEVMKWMETIRREVLPENISSQVRTFQDDLYEVQAVEYILKDIISFFCNCKHHHYPVGSVFQHYARYRTPPERGCHSQSERSRNTFHHLAVCTFVPDFADGDCRHHLSAHLRGIATVETNVHRIF